MLNIPNDLAVLVPWLIGHGYLIFLIAATIEGPITTIAGGVVAALGYFNIYYILALAVLGDIGGDFLYFGIGYMSHNLIHSRFFRYFGLTEERVVKLEKLVHTHMQRAIILIKLSPVIGPIGIVIIGAARPKLKKFLKIALYIAIPKSLFFALLGFYSGQTYLSLNKVIANGQDIIIWIAAVVAIIYFAYVKIMGVITRRMSK